MSIIGVGIDLCDIGRIASSLEKPGFLRRVYTSAEREYIAGRGKLAASSAAGIFCVKEAVIKAAGTGIELTEMEVLHNSEGAPRLQLSGKAAEKYRGFLFHISITHTDSTASAVAVMEELSV